MQTIIEVPLQQFELVRFIREMLAFHEAVMERSDPANVVLVVDDRYDLALPKVQGRRYLLSELHAGVVLYFDYSQLNMEGQVRCVDRTTRRTDGTVVETGHGENDEEGDVMADARAHGFILAVSEGKVIIKLAIMSLGMCMPPEPCCVRVIDNSDGFYVPMVSFLKKFIKTDMPTPATDVLESGAQQPG